VSDDLVYVGSRSGYVYAYAAGGCGEAMCLPRWTAPTGSPVRSTPAVAHDHLYVAAEDGGIRGYPARGCDKLACAPAWSRKLGGRGGVGPTASADRVFAAAEKSGAPHVAAYDPAGNRAWIAPAPGEITNLATDGALIHGTTAHGEVFALDARDGKLAWKSPSLGKITGAPAIVNHTLYVGVIGVDATPELLVLRDRCAGATCEPLARISTGKDTVGPTAAAICRGRVHVANGARLLALAPR
jgi:outer membrane protein assembly factor BamB